MLIFRKSLSVPKPCSGLWLLIFYFCFQPFTYAGTEPDLLRKAVAQLESGYIAESPARAGQAPGLCLLLLGKVMLATGKTFEQLCPCCDENSKIDSCRQWYAENGGKPIADLSPNQWKLDQQASRYGNYFIFREYPLYGNSTSRHAFHIKTQKWRDLGASTDTLYFSPEWMFQEKSETYHPSTWGAHMAVRTQLSWNATSMKNGETKSTRPHILSHGQTMVLGDGLLVSGVERYTLTPGLPGAHILDTPLYTTFWVGPGEYPQSILTSRSLTRFIPGSHPGTALVAQSIDQQTFLRTQGGKLYKTSFTVSEYSSIQEHPAHSRVLSDERWGVIQTPCQPRGFTPQNGSQPIQKIRIIDQKSPTYISREFSIAQNAVYPSFSDPAVFLGNELYQVSAHGGDLYRLDLTQGEYQIVSSKWVAFPKYSFTPQLVAISRLGSRVIALYEQGVSIYETKTGEVSRVALPTGISHLSRVGEYLYFVLNQKLIRARLSGEIIWERELEAEIHRSYFIDRDVIFTVQKTGISFPDTRNIGTAIAYSRRDGGELYRIPGINLSEAITEQDGAVALTLRDESAPALNQAIQNSYRLKLIPISRGAATQGAPTISESR